MTCKRIGQLGRPNHVDIPVPRRFKQRLPGPGLSRKVIDDGRTVVTKYTVPGCCVGNISHDKFCGRMQCSGSLLSFMNLRVEIVQHHDSMSSLHEKARYGTADKTGTTGHQNLFFQIHTPTSL